MIGTIYKLKIDDLEIRQRFHIYWRCPVCGYQYSTEDDGFDNLEDMNIRLNEILGQDWVCYDCGGK